MKSEAETQYGRSSVKVLGGLEPVRKRPPLFAGCANPVLMSDSDKETLAAIIMFEDTLLLSFKHYKVHLAVIMRRLKRYKASLADRAALIMQAIASLSSTALPASDDAYQRCKRFLMLTAQHDDAIRDCPAATLSRI